MRNLIEYPVTWEEKYKLLEGLMASLDNEEIIGDMRPVILREIYEDLWRLESLID